MTETIMLPGVGSRESVDRHDTVSGVSITLGEAGMTIDFAGDRRLVHYDAQTGEGLVGAQQVTVESNQLSLG